MQTTLSDEQICLSVSEHGTPVYIYSASALEAQAEAALAFKAPFGRTVRYAMKANPHPKFLATLSAKGLKIDASSGGEVQAAMKAGIAPEDINLNSQELPENLAELLGEGIFFIATSLRQLQRYGEIAPDTNVGIRINPGLGSGMNNRTTTGGINAGFGIWYEYLPEVDRIAKKHNLTITTLHTHIGSGTDPAAWQQTARITLELLNDVPTATTVSFGGGFKTGRMPDEPTADMAGIGQHISELITIFADETGRKMHIEIEPGTFIAAKAGWLVARITDITDTGENGHTFLRVNTGMNDILRFSMYGAQHDLRIIAADARNISEEADFMIVGHCCESSDILTPEKGDAEAIAPRKLQVPVVDDYLLVNGCGAYCASMRAVGYNSFKSAGEVFVT